MTLTIVAGARPNFIKIAPIIKALQDKKKTGFTIDFRLVHTGQHYDKNLSDSFFEELNIPKPHINLGVKSGTQAQQTAAIMIAFEKELIENPSDLVMVVGDVTSTMACTIVAKKAGIVVAHVEAGIRSGDMSMPEEINRIVTDSLSDYFFTTSTHANGNLKRLGVPDRRIFFVGNVMIDTLTNHMSHFKKPSFFDKHHLRKGGYFVMTLHRPSNVDEAQQLKRLVSKIISLSKDFPVIFPVHPRTKKHLQELNLTFDNLHYVEPQSYLHFNYLVKNAFAVITDSGGITEETTVMNIPCITLRHNTERPETCTIGTNMLVGDDPKKIENAFKILWAGNWKQGEKPQLWDGKAAERIVEHLTTLYPL